MYRVGDTVSAITGARLNCGEVSVTLQVKATSSDGFYLVRIIAGLNITSDLWTTGKDRWFTFVVTDPSCL
jgi:hypothetical protein